MLSELTNTDLALLVAGVVVIPWLVYVTKALQHIGTDTHWTRRQHEPDQDGVQAWKNPGLAAAIDRNTEVLRDLERALAVLQAVRD